jgi:hypothetical protein
VDLYKTVFELIELRSFSNLWFWIALAVMWSSASHWVLGVPFDLVTRARKNGGQASEDLEALVGINVRRLMFITQVSGLWIIGFLSFVLTGLLVLGFFYAVEFAQAVFLLAAPMAIVGSLSLSTARQIRDQTLSGDYLQRRLSRHRMAVQGIGMISIFITSLWGMWQNLQLGPF